MATAIYQCGCWGNGRRCVQHGSPEKRGPVRQPMPSVAPSLIRMAIFTAAAVSALSLAVSGSLVFAMGVCAFITLVEGNRRRYKQTIKVRKQLREDNFWAVIDHQINTELPAPSVELVKIEALLEKAHREYMAQQGVQEVPKRPERTPPNPNSKRSHKKRERRERRESQRMLTRGL